MTAFMQGEAPSSPFSPQDMGMLLDDGSMEMDLMGGLGQEPQEEPPFPFDGNLALVLPEEELQSIGQEVLEGYKQDKQSRADWEMQIEKALKLLGLKVETTTVPFQGAATATHPLLLESAVKFQSKAIQEIFPPGGPVKTKIFGKVTPDREQQASRVKEYMNYQLVEQMVEYYDDTERLLFSLPLVGSAFKKLYFDPTLDRPVSEYIPIDNFVIDYYAADLRRAHRYTHCFSLSKEDLERYQSTGFYKDTDIGAPSRPEVPSLQSAVDRLQGFSQPPLERYELLEQHVYLKLSIEEDSLAAPYVVTVDKQSGSVLAVRRNWDIDDQRRQKIVWFAHYKFVPGFGFYGLGLTHLVGNLSAALTAALRSLLDAGQFANLQGGFKQKGFRVVGDNDPISPGEWRDVEALSGALKDALLPLPYKEPSQVLFQLLQWADQRGLQFADSTEAVVAESTNYGPVATTMALLEQSTRFFSAIHKRLHKSQREELRILAYINWRYVTTNYPYEVEAAPQQPAPGQPQGGPAPPILQQDFDGRVDILPVSDPNIPSQAHRLAQAQLQFQLAQQTPQLHDMREVVRRVYVAAGIADIDKLMPPVPPPPQPMDPVGEWQALMAAQPVQAFPGQDHASHIAFLLATAQDPAYEQSMPQVQPRLQALVSQHFALMRREEIEAATGQPLPPFGQPVPPELEVQFAQAVAQAATSLAAARQAQEEDKGALAQAKLQLDAENLRLKEKQIDSQENRDIAKIATQQQQLDLQEKELTTKTALERERMRHEQQQKHLDRLSGVHATLRREEGQTERMHATNTAKFAQESLRGLQKASKENDKARIS